MAGRLALGLLLAACTALISAPPSLAAPAGIRPFSLADVELLHGTEYKQNMELNLRFLTMLEVDRLAYNFRVTAGLPAPGEPYGGWEDRSVEVRGQFMGHYLSAMAFAYQNTGDAKYRERAAEFVSALKEAQEANGDGYLSAFPREHFERLEGLQPVWAPYYVIHKIMAGLLDQHQLAKNPNALGMVEEMAHYFCARVDNVLKVNGTQHWEAVLEVEFGGMNEVLYNLQLETGKAEYGECAHHFDKPAFYRPMVEGRDVLAGQHANTHLAQANGFGARYEATGDEEARSAVRNFFDIVTGAHSFSTGGSNWYEHWYPPHTLGDAISNADASLITEESCTQYNILKVARYLFRWTGDAALADYYERAILNDVIGIQRHAPGFAPPEPPAGLPEEGKLASGRALLGHSHHSHPHSHAHAHYHPHQHPSMGEHHHHHHSMPGMHSMPGSSAWGAGAAGTGGQEEDPAVAQQLAAAGAAPAVDAAGMAAAYAAQPRPDNYQVVSWPDDPGRHFRPAANDLEFSPGQYIYYLPLGTGNSKGDQRGWVHGWGDPYHTFWCCYGTAVESLSKLADSIFFHRMPKSSATGEAGAASLPASPLAAGKQLPELFVNQFVGAKLRWRELGVKVTLEADLYSAKTEALVRLTIKLKDKEGGNSEEGAGSARAKGAGRSFVINWRVPSWTDPQALRLTVNGKQQDACAEGARRAAGGAGAGNEGGKAPPYGKGARYCSLGPDWEDGDVIEAELPMLYSTEDLNDDREEMRDLKAIMMGPLMMAGLTDDTNDLAADPSAIGKAISVPDPQGLVSLEALLAPAEGADAILGAAVPLLLRRGSGGNIVSLALQGQVGASRASAMDATFRRVPGLAGDSAPRASEEGGDLMSLESMARPGFYLSEDGKGGLVLRQPGTPEDELAATFAVHAEGSNAAAFHLEPLSAPGTRLRLPALLDGDAGQVVATTPSPTAFRLAPPAAPSYPPGARLLKGSNRSYLLLPIGQVVDERYTGYFHFVKPSGGRGEGEGAALVGAAGTADGPGEAAAAE